MNEYTVLKLLTGQDIICTVNKTKMTEQLIEVHYPMLIINNNTSFRVNMIYLKNYNILSKNSTTVMRRDDIMSSYVPQLELVAHYKVYKKYNIEILDKLCAMELNMASAYMEAFITSRMTDPNYLNKLFYDMLGIAEDVNDSNSDDISKIKKSKTTKVH